MQLFSIQSAKSLQKLSFCTNKRARKGVLCLHHNSHTSFLVLFLCTSDKPQKYQSFYSWKMIMLLWLKFSVFPVWAMLWIRNAKELFGFSKHILLNWDSQFFMKLRHILSYVGSSPQWPLPKLYYQVCCTPTEYRQSKIFIHQINIIKCPRQ